MWWKAFAFGNMLAFVFTKEVEFLRVIVKHSCQIKALGQGNGHPFTGVGNTYVHKGFPTFSTIRVHRS